MGLKLFLFGSALVVAARPADLDVLVIYEDREMLCKLRSGDWWEHFDPPLHILGLTEAEEAHYDFIQSVRAVRLV